MKKNNDPNLKAFLAAKAREEYEEECFLLGKENLDDEIQEEEFPHKIKVRISDPNLKAFLAAKAREEYEEMEEEEEE